MSRNVLLGNSNPNYILYKLTLLNNYRILTPNVNDVVHKLYKNKKLKFPIMKLNNFIFNIIFYTSVIIEESRSSSPSFGYVTITQNVYETKSDLVLLFLFHYLPDSLITSLINKGHYLL